jgi:uncharacterized NAD(P)/FAD-binding protein YdhS
MPQPSHIVTIVGGRISGSALATYLLSSPPAGIEVHMIDPATDAGQISAPGDANSPNPLNVPAGRLSLYGDAPNDFVRWARHHGPRLGWPQAATANSASYLPRQLFYQYVQSALEEAAARALSSTGTKVVRHVGTVTRLTRSGERLAIDIDTGARIDSDTIVLAPGFRAPEVPFPVSGEGSRFIADPWTQNALGGIGRHDRIIAVGSGLMLVDVIASLNETRHRGKVTAISSHGLLPFVRGVSEPHPPMLTEADASLGLRHAFRKLRAAIADGQGDWRTAIDSLRPITDALWRSLPPPDQDRMLRHLRPYWELQRHRLPADSADMLLRWASRRQLDIVAGRIASIEQRADGIDLIINHRGGTREPERWSADWVINCLPPASLFSEPRNPLTESLLAAGLARPNRTGQGFDHDPAGHAIDTKGNSVENVFILGQARRGHAFEAALIPTLRPQFESLAASIIRRVPTRPRRARR